MLPGVNVFCFSATMSDELSVEDLSKFKIKNAPSFLKVLKQDKNIEEVAIIQKCNSVEILIVSKSNIADAVIFEKVIDLWQRNSLGSITEYLNKIKLYTNEDVVLHVLQVGCGLKSVELGDTQVRGQINNARDLAKEAGTLGPILETVLYSINPIDDYIKKETKLHEGNICIERTACEELTKKINNLGAPIGLVGLGSSGKIIANCLHEKGFKNVTLLNRTFETAVEVASKYGFKVRKFDELKEVLPLMEAMIFCVDVQKYLVDINDLSVVSHPLFIIDLGSPPNVNPALSEGRQIEILSLDKLSFLGEERERKRKEEADKAYSIIKRELPSIIQKIKQRYMNKIISDNIKNFTPKLIAEKKSIILLRSNLCKYAREYLSSRGFIEVHTPFLTIVPTDPIQKPKEQELFAVDWFGKEIYLSQSPQLHKQMLILSGLEKIYEIAPYWMAERSPSDKYLIESWALDIEMKGIKSHIEIMDMLEQLILFLINKFKTEQKELLEELKVEISIPEKPFPRISYEEAIKKLEKKGLILKFGTDLNDTYEKILGAIMKEEGSSLFFVEKYPASLVKFYIRTDALNLTDSFHLYYNGWKIASGGMRETRITYIKKKMVEEKLPAEMYEFYLKFFRRRHVPPHGGCAMGIERFLAAFLGVDSLISVTPFPRTPIMIVP
jgi:aspartyl-tRNA synthetase